MAGKAVSRFLEINSQNYSLNNEGKARLFSDEERDYFKAENEAIAKLRETQALKQQIFDETNAVILESQKEISQKGSILMQALGGIQTYANPRNWARGTIGLGKMIVEDVTTPFVTGSKSISEQNTATNLYSQSKDLADQAAKIVKTDRPQAEALLKQSQALAEEANKFSQGEATKTIMGADDKLTGKEIFAKSALAGLTVGSALPVGSVAKGSFMLAKTVPAAVQGSKTVTVGNIITRGLGLGDIYQVTKTGVKQGFKQEVKQTIFGQAVKSTFQAPVMAGLMEAADDDGVNNYWGSVGTNAIGAFGLTLGFGYAGKILGSVTNKAVGGIDNQFAKGATPANMPTSTAEPQKLLPLPQEAVQATTTVDGKVVNLPPSAYSQSALDPNVFEPKAQVIGTTVNEPLPNMYASLGAFNPETDIPMVDLTETIKANNIDFNPDSVLSINSTRKTVDDIALLNGNEVGGKKLKINTEDPKYKEVYTNMIKPLVDRINEVDSNNLSKIPIEEVELEVNKIYSELENAGIPITPEKVRHTPHIDKLDEKLARGEQTNPEEFDKGMKEYVNSTGKTEVIDGVQEELTGPMKKSAYAERLNKENPGLNLSSVEYQSAVVKDLEEVAKDLIDNNFDEAGRIAKNINKDSSLQDIKTGELYINKLIELGKKDELAQVYHTFSREATRAGQRTGILQEKKIGTPQYAIKQAQDQRMSKIKPEIEKQVAVVKREMSSVSVDQNFISDILDNITCR